MIQDRHKNELKVGDRIFTIDIDRRKVYGILKKNEHKETSEYEYSVLYDDGEECVVLDFNQIWKIFK